MAYHVDEQDEGAIVLDGHAEGIADSPYEGISDMRNINITSIPDEASVNFSTSQISPVNHGTTTILSADSGADTITLASNQVIGSGQAVTFTGGSLPSPLLASTIYWLTQVSGADYHVYTNYGRTTLVNIAGTGTGTVTPSAMGKPKYYVYDTSKYWMVDATGQVWSNTQTSTDPITGVATYWTFTGNKVNNNSNGNGLAFYPSQNLSSFEPGYIMVFSNGSIDITSTGTINADNVSWNYQWNPLTGAYGGYNANPTNRLKNNNNNIIHETFLAPDNTLFYCDGYFIGQIFQTDRNTPFDPTATSTYTFDPTALLPSNDIAQSLTFLGTNLMVGGTRNVIYPWDTTSPTFTNPILLAENNIIRMVTVNTNTYVFVGNRGRIYITNGAQAQLYKKLPDHLSGTIEPYYSWGGATSNKNQLFFSALVTTNSGSANNNYGGVWAIDLDTKGMRLSNQLSYGTYAGYSTAMIPNFATAPAGTGLFIGWDNGSNGYGMDTTSSSPYTASQAYVDYDLLPIGTYLKPNTPKKVEFKLSVPMVSGESVSLYYRLKFSDSYTLIFTSNTAGTFSDTHNTNFNNAQWLQLRAVLNSTASTPSYTRLTEIRIRAN